MPLLLTEFTKWSGMRSSMFDALLTILRYRSTNGQAGLNLNIPVNLRECFT
jgi:hypothetical protein